ECHEKAAAEEHEDLPLVDCRQCHAPHDEKVIHDAHTRVACTACHQRDGIAVVDPASGEVIFGGKMLAGQNPLPHQMVLEKGDALCRNCHFKGNDLGASSMILPAKGILCMPCHVATFSIGDRVTVFSLLIFAVGMSGLGVIWLSGAKSESSGHRCRSGLRPLMVAMVTDVLFIKRLYRLSPSRWVIHALIYYPILIRLAFGMMALGLSLFLPETELAGAMLDKNHPFRALLFDLTGLMILTGATAALLRSKKGRGMVTHLPAPGLAMTALLGLIALVGFLLEGLRIAMTGWPGGAHYAFMGYGVSLLVNGMTGITNIYGYVWYVHAVLAGTFGALIPFTRMIHIITAPVVLMADARSAVQQNH
ncbi:MAG: hypothetical protein ABFS43_19845, partial [Thermodesulfobacteriota bacterium]